MSIPGYGGPTLMFTRYLRPNTSSSSTPFLYASSKRALSLAQKAFHPPGVLGFDGPSSPCSSRQGGGRGGVNAG